MIQAIAFVNYLQLAKLQVVNYNHDSPTCFVFLTILILKGQLSHQIFKAMAHAPLHIMKPNPN
jgi:hypothetical protein